MNTEIGNVRAEHLYPAAALLQRLAGYIRECANNKKAPQQISASIDLAMVRDCIARANATNLVDFDADMLIERVGRLDRVSNMPGSRDNWPQDVYPLAVVLIDQINAAAASIENVRHNARLFAAVFAC